MGSPKICTLTYTHKATSCFYCHRLGPYLIKLSPPGISYSDRHSLYPHQLFPPTPLLRSATNSLATIPKFALCFCFAYSVPRPLLLLSFILLCTCKSSLGQSASGISEIFLRICLFPLSLLKNNTRDAHKKESCSQLGNSLISRARVPPRSSGPGSNPTTAHQPLPAI